MKRLIGLIVFLFLLSGAYGQAVDCNKIYNVNSPFSPDEVNNYVKGLKFNTCISLQSYITLRFNTTGGDTVVFNSPLILTTSDVSSSFDSSTNLFLKIEGSTAGKPVFLSRSNAGNSIIQVANLGNVSLDNIGFTDKGVASAVPLLDIANKAKRTEISHCLFSLQSTSNIGIQVGGDSTTIINSVFRSANPGVTAIQINDSAYFTEVRGNFFYNSILKTRNHEARVLINTFAGNGITNEGMVDVPTTGAAESIRKMVFWRNMFALRTPGGYAIKNGSLDVNDVLVENVFNASALFSPGTPAVSNVKAPRSWVDYNNLAFPVASMASATDLVPLSLLLVAPKTYLDLGAKDLIKDLATISADSNSWKNYSYRRNTLLSPLTGSFAPGIRVGCIGTVEAAYRTPNPISQISFAVKASDSTKVGLRSLVLDTAYHNKRIPPSTMVYYVSLDTAAIKGKYTAAEMSVLSQTTTRFLDSSVIGVDTSKGVTVPRQLRSTGAPLYIKALPKYNGASAGTGFAPDLGTSWSLIPKVPKYPLSDFTISDVVAGINGCEISNLRFENAKEDIDSVEFRLHHTTSLPSTDLTLRASINSAYPTIKGLKKGYYTITAWAISKDNSAILGSPKTKDSITACKDPGDTRFVRNKKNCLIDNGSGTKENPYCKIENALVDKATNNSLTVVLMNGGESIDGAQVVDQGDTKPLIIVDSAVNSNAFRLSNRVIVRNMFISRPYVTLRGLVFESKKDSAALTVAKGGVVVEQNIFRNGVSAGSHIVFATPNVTDTVKIQNNLFFDGAPIFQFSSGGAIRIFNNTFIDSVGTGSTWGQPSAGATLNLIVASNFFTSTGLGSNYLKGFLPDLQGQVQYFHNVVNNASPPSANLGNSFIYTSDEFLRSDLTPHNYAVYYDVMEKYFGDPNKPSKIWSASHPIYYSANSFYNNPTNGKREVGAFEDTTNNLNSSAELTLEAKSNTVINVTVKSRQFYPESNTNYLHIWWAEGSPTTVSYPTDPLFRDQKSVDVLASNGVIDDTIMLDKFGPVGLKNYTICIDFGSSTKINGKYTNCKFVKTLNPPSPFDCIDSVKAIQTSCPAFPTIWKSTTPSGDTAVSSVIFSASVTGFNIGKPEIKAVDAAITTKLGTALSAVNGLPVINTNSVSYQASDATLSSTIKHTWEIFFPTKIVTTGASLIRIDNEGALYLVPQWTVQDSGIGGSKLRITEKYQGAAQYVFVKSSNTNAVIPTLTVGSTTFTDNNDSAFSIQVSGTFHTANPMIAILPIPAGAKMRDDDQVFTVDYPSNLFLYQLDLAENDKAYRDSSLKPLYTMLAKLSDSGKTDNDFGKIPFVLPSDVSGVGNKISANGLEVFKGLTNRTLNFSLNKKYVKKQFRRKMTRSIEVVVAVLDGDQVSFQRQFIRTAFSSSSEMAPVPDTSIANGDVALFSENRWNLFSYPWEEDVSGQTQHHRILGIADNDVGKDFRDENFYLYRWDGTLYQKYNAGRAAEALPYSAGKAVWAARASSKIIPKTSGGQSLDYKSFDMALNAGWNDIGLPFNFPMRWADVLRVSGNPTVAIWEFNNNWTLGNGEPSWKPIVGTSIVWPWRGYAVQLANGAAGTLTFPVLDIDRSPAVVAKTAAVQTKYVVNLDVFNNSGRSRLTMGAANVLSTYGAAPGAPGQSFMASIKNNQEFLSKQIIASTNNDPATWEIVIQSTAKTSVEIAAKQGVPDSYMVALVDPVSAKYYVLSDGQTELPAAPSGKNYKIAIGTANYFNQLIEKGLYSLNATPHPIREFVALNYRLPVDLYKLGNWKWNFEIYDLRGKSLYSAKNILDGAEWSLRLPVKELRQKETMMFARITLTGPQGQKFVGQKRLVRLY